jgi:hypothetical protein
MEELSINLDENEINIVLSALKSCIDSLNKEIDELPVDHEPNDPTYEKHFALWHDIDEAIELRARFELMLEAEAKPW